MEFKDFLRLVTADGLRCISMQTDVGFVQMPATTADEAVRLAEWADGQKKNTFYALATFKEEHLNGSGKRRVARKRSNVDQLKALWVDIDFKSCPTPTLEGALLEVRKFIKTSGFVKPTAIVSSGNGLHLYWPLSEAVPYREWKVLADRFKHLCQTASLPADHACTADAARVLRPIGSRNWKDAANPKLVKWFGGSGLTYNYDQLYDSISGQHKDHHRRTDLPAHLQKAAASGPNSKEYTKNAAKPQNSRQMFKKCGVLRYILKTAGGEQDEPEWNATMMVLAHLDDGAKYVHPMSKGHPEYNVSTTIKKWQQKVEAAEGGSGPTLCRTFESYHKGICKACPFYESKKVKTPKSLAYLEDDTPAPPSPGSKAPHLQSASKFQQGQYPFGWRVGGNKDCIERKVWNEETKQYEWAAVLRQVWELRKASRSIQSDQFELLVVNKHGQSVRKIDIPAWQFGTSQDLQKTIANYGCTIVGQDEFRHFKALMQTWLDELRKANQIEDITGQLGWIIDTESDEQQVLGFATGTSAYYLNGEAREGVVSASGKYKGIMDSFKPMGVLEPWTEAAEAIIEQGCDHLIALLSTAFAAPLMRFTEQPGAVVSFVSEDSAAGKSTGLRLAQAVWGNPRHAPATMDDTQTVVKNKLAFLQNLPAYWDEVRGGEDKMQSFIQIAFQVAQGRDRERANSKAETIRAEEWQTLLAACSNDSLFDLAAEKAVESNAGIYRIFEIVIPKAEYPIHDAEIMSLISQLDRNFGHAGLVYAKYLTQHYDEIRDEVNATRRALEKKAKLKGPERFWIAALTAMILGAKYAGKCGLVQIDTKRLLNYLFNNLHQLRARAVLGKQRLSPRELVASYAQHHQDGKVTVDWFPTGPGGKRDPILQGNHSHVRKVSYVEALDLNMLMVNKADFRTWLEKSKRLRFNSKIIAEFENEVNMVEKKAQLAAGTSFKLPRAQCLIFDLNEAEDSDYVE